MKCSIDNCRNEARWQVSWQIMPLPPAAALRGAMVFVTTATVCPEHREQLTVWQLTTPDGRADINNTMIRNNRPAVDFTTARPTFHELINGMLPLPPPPGTEHVLR